MHIAQNFSSPGDQGPHLTQRVVGYYCQFAELSRKNQNLLKPVRRSKVQLNGLSLYYTVFRKKHTLMFSFYLSGKCLDFHKKIQGMFRRKLILHKCKSYIFFGLSMTSC